MIRAAFSLPSSQPAVVWSDALIRGTMQPLSTDDLTAPLGQAKPRKRRFRLTLNWMHAAAAVVAVFLLGFLSFALFNDNPLGGEPMARVAIDAASVPAAQAPAQTQTPQPPAKQATAPASASGDQHTITIIDGSSGARRNVVVPGSGAGSETPAAAASSAGSVSAGVNPRLLESSRYGMIPVIADGLKPSNAYAGGDDTLRARAVTMPSIAIVISGLGVGAAKTNDAITKLPPAVTLAFTPYGSDPARLVALARTRGHEVMLQVPMEPFDYPDNDPGPQTLLTSLPAEQNLDRLHWHLSRIQGYAGLANFMGSRFVATDAAMQPLMREAAKRGLAWFDDGSAARSVAGTVAKGQTVPFARADRVIDAVPTATEIDRVLADLETTARQRGLAVGVASALPISIDRIAAWTKVLEGRGILLVPLTTAMQKSKSG